MAFCYVARPPRHVPSLPRSPVSHRSCPLSPHPPSQAGLAATLMSPGPFTLFAPNDDAFADAVKALGTTKLGLRDLPNLPVRRWCKS